MIMATAETEAATGPSATTDAHPIALD